MKSLQERYEAVVEAAGRAFATDLHYLLDIARISRRVALRQREQ